MHALKLLTFGFDQKLTSTLFGYMYTLGAFIEFSARFENRLKCYNTMQYNALVTRSNLRRGQSLGRWCDGTKGRHTPV